MKAAANKSKIVYGELIMGKKILSQIMAIMLVCVLITGCGAGQTAGGGDTFGTASSRGAADYSDDSNWLAKPDITKTADTFYIYPTAYTDPSEDAAEVCDIDNEQIFPE